jgi:hypothetical protein
MQGSQQSGRASPGLGLVWCARRSPRQSTARGLTGIFGAGLVWTGSAGGPGKRGRFHDPLASYLIWAASGFPTTGPLLGVLGHNHNTYKIVYTLKSTGKVMRTRLSKYSVYRRRKNGGTVSEIRWAFLVLWLGFLLLGAFGHHHNDTYNIVYTLKSTRKIRR